MSLTQESVLSWLIAERGRVKKSDLVAKFKSSVDCVDPAEKERNRELFKTFVNNVAVVREVDGVRYVVVKKVYQHLLEGARAEAEGRTEERTGTGERQSPGSAGTGAHGSAGDPPPDPDQASESSESRENPTELVSVIQLALQRSKYSDFRLRRMLNFEVQGRDTSGGHPSPRGEVNEPWAAESKPFALPLRVPPCATRVEVCKLKPDSSDPNASPKLDAPRYKRRPPSAEERAGGCSPQPRRAVKSTKASEDSRMPSSVPLEQAEHEWLVKCSTGHWNQVYGLLLRDSQLADRRDFMSGFTALHWAAKCGNSEMLMKIIDLSERDGVDLDINAKSHGGYTPLHIAALHDQGYVMATLVGEYGADVSIRDNSGKKACHYLHKGISPTLREMLGGPQAQQAPERAVPQEREEPEIFPDITKGLHSISRLFQPNVTGLRKKHKQRPGFYSLSDPDPSVDREDGGSSSFRQRVVSDAFM